MKTLDHTPSLTAIPDADADATARALALLTALGTTPQQVAESLHTLDYRGLCTQPALDPLARYLQDRLDDLNWRIGTREAFRMSGEHVPLPAAVSAFLRAFDHGDYPNLIGMGGRRG